jgi:hypothetical protein
LAEGKRHIQLVAADLGVNSAELAEFGNDLPLEDVVLIQLGEATERMSAIDSSTVRWNEV